MPFAVQSNCSSLPNPPPALTSDEYAADFNEVKELGSDSTTRTADQTQSRAALGKCQHSDDVFFVWNNVARTLSVSRNLTTIQMSTAVRVVQYRVSRFAANYFDEQIRLRFVATRDGDSPRRRRRQSEHGAGRSMDVADSTPPYPTYAGNMRQSALRRRRFSLCFSDATIFVLDTPGNGAGGGGDRFVSGFTAMANEEANSRIYGGIHFRFDNVAGQSAGRNVANYVFLNFMRPRLCVR